jgi:hypothetical protein
MEKSSPLDRPIWTMVFPVLPRPSTTNTCGLGNRIGSRSRSGQDSRCRAIRSPSLGLAKPGAVDGARCLHCAESA